MKGQTAQICAKIDKLLAEVGSSKEKLVTAMLYITDFSQKEGMDEAWLAWLPAEHLPTRATIGVAELGEKVLTAGVVGPLWPPRRVTPARTDWARAGRDPAGRAQPATGRDRAAFQVCAAASR